MERDAEIYQIKRELEVLRARYALYERWGRILKIFFMVWVPLFVIALVALGLKLSAFDAVYGGFFLGMLAVVAAILWLLRNAESADRARLRWIDLASLQVSPFSMYPDLPFTFHRRGSDAQVIEEQISAREQRLSELGKAP